MKTLSIYIHIPFCESKCLYCDFASGVAKGDIVDRYKQAIIDEINAFDSNGYNVDTIFIGGGTPTSVPVEVIAEIVNVIKQKFVLDIAEFTIEGNPNSFTSDKLAVYKSLGVTRVSIGVQSLEDSVLKAIGRVHTAEIAKECIDRLVTSGLRVSCDLMVGLPRQTIDMVKRDSEYILSRGVEHLSCYSLILEEGTPLYSLVQSGKLTLPSEDETVDMYDTVKSIAERHGLPRYEISNFGKPCLHNVGYWQMKEYAGFGLSAHSLIGNKRYYNTANMTEYLNRAEYQTEEILTLEDMAKEFVMLGLRCDFGVDIELMKSKYGEEQTDKMLNIARGQNEYITITDKAFFVKEKYSYVANSIIEKFI